MITLADYMNQTQPGMQLPVNGGTQQSYNDNIGVAPIDFNTLISSLTQAQQIPNQGWSQNLQPTQDPQQMPQQQSIGDMSLAGNPGTLSGRIQQWLGAQPKDEGGQVQDILSGRFQAPLNMNDVGIAAQATAAKGEYVPAQEFANQRVSSGFDALQKLAQANYYNAIGANGGGRSEGMAAAMRIMSENNADPTKAPMSFTQAYMLATAKQGQGVTVDPNTGQVTTMQGAPQAAATMAQGKEGGTQSAKLAYAGPIAGSEANARNVSDISAAAPKAAQEEVGKAQGEALTSLADIQANLPQLSAITNKLLTLGQTATYTKAGQAYNAGVRQFGLSVPQAGVDRAAYESTVNNFLLPTLKQTFGARITNFDLENIKTTLANANLSPAEKDAQLKSFIAQKFMQAGTDQNQVNALGATPIQPAQNQTAPIPAQTEANTQNAQVPQGAQPTGKTIGGKPVYTLPNGKGWIPD